jgi:serine/threonine protein kinase/outer membrane biosynthesis protein TonB
MAEYHQVGKYVLLRELPETPLGRNFRAAELGPTGLNRIVHLTRLINEVAPEAKFQTMLQGKYFGMGRVLHEGISKGFEVNNIGGVFLSQENVQGFSIKAIIKRCVKNNLPFSLDYALYTAAKICNALEYAHGQMIGTDPLIHGGLTPYNVFITFDGDVKIQDWSVVACADYMANARNIFLQRFQLYLAPEQVEGRSATQSVDIFQVGLIFYEMITGSPLFTINRQENVQQMIEELYTHQRVFDGKTPPPEMLSIILKALSINPATRYPSIRAMREELDTLLYSGVYLATATKTSFFINSIYKDEIKNLKANLESEININYAAYLQAASAPQPTPQQGAASGQAEELSAEEISAQMLPDTGVIEVEDEGIGTEVGDDFISYTRKKKSRWTPILIGIAAVAFISMLIYIIAGGAQPEVKVIDSPEAIARKAELEQQRRAVADKTREIEATAAELKAAQDKVAQLESDKIKREQDTRRIAEEADRMKADVDARRIKDEEDRRKKAADEQAERDRLARIAATMDAGSNQPSGNPSTSTTLTATTSTPPPSTNTSVTSTSIPYVRGDDPNLIMNPIRQPKPSYPKSLERSGIRRSAMVNLLLYVDINGDIERVTKLTGEDVFAAEAIRTVKSWKYTPPVLKNGNKVKVTKTVTFNF